MNAEKLGPVGAILVSVIHTALAHRLESLALANAALTVHSVDVSDLPPHILSGYQEDAVWEGAQAGAAFVLHEQLGRLAVQVEKQASLDLSDNLMGIRKATAPHLEGSIDNLARALRKVFETPSEAVLAHVRTGYAEALSRFVEGFRRELAEHAAASNMSVEQLLQVLAKKEQAKQIEKT